MSIRFNEVRHAHSQDRGDAGQLYERDVVLAPFEAGDVGAVHVAGMSEAFLAQAFGRAELPDAGADTLEEGMRGAGRHAAMVSAGAVDGLRDISVACHPQM